MKKILITGAYGYLGMVLIKILKKSYKIIALDTMLYGEKLIMHKNVKNYIGTVEDDYLINKIFNKNKNINTIIHLSGVSNDPSALLSKKLTKKTNINSTQILIYYCNKYNVQRFLFASSCSVYGFTGNKKFVDENSKVNPLSDYAVSKIKSEKIIFKNANSKLCVTSLRKATLFGMSPRMRFDLVVNTMTGSAFDKKKNTVNGGNQWRPFLHVEDAAFIYKKFIEVDTKLINGKIFNVGNTKHNYQISKVAGIISKITNSKISKSGNDDNRSYKVNFDKLSKVLNYTPQKGIAEGCKEILKAFKTKKIKNFRDINYYNIKRLLSFLNIE